MALRVVVTCEGIVRQHARAAPPPITAWSSPHILGVPSRRPVVVRDPSHRTHILPAGQAARAANFAVQNSTPCWDTLCAGAAAAADAPPGVLSPEWRPVRRVLRFLARRRTALFGALGQFDVRSTGDDDHVWESHVQRRPNAARPWQRHAVRSVAAPAPHFGMPERIDLLDELRREWDVRLAYRHTGGAAAAAVDASGGDDLPDFPFVADGAAHLRLATLPTAEQPLGAQSKELRPAGRMRRFYPAEGGELDALMRLMGVYVASARCKAKWRAAPQAVLCEVVPERAALIDECLRDVDSLLVDDDRKAIYDAPPQRPRGASGGRMEVGSDWRLRAVANKARVELVSGANGRPAAAAWMGGAERRLVLHVCSPTLAAALAVLCRDGVDRRVPSMLLDGRISAIATFTAALHAAAAAMEREVLASTLVAARPHGEEPWSERRRRPRPRPLEDSCRIALALESAEVYSARELLAAGLSYLLSRRQSAMRIVRPSIAAPEWLLAAAAAESELDSLTDALTRDGTVGEYMKVEACLEPAYAFLTQKPDGNGGVGCPARGTDLQAPTEEECVVDLVDAVSRVPVVCSRKL